MMARTPSPATSLDDVSFSDLSLLTSPPTSKKKLEGTSPSFSTSAEASSSHVAQPSRPRPTGSTRPPVASFHKGSNAAHSGMRFLQGVDGRVSGQAGGPPLAAAGRSANAKQRRTSLFAPSAIPGTVDNVALKRQHKGEKIGREDGESFAALNDDPDANDSLMFQQSAAAPQRHSGTTSSSSHPSSSAPGETGWSSPGRPLASQTESKEQMQRQLDELGKMNSTFEAYERMLQGSAGQIELFSHRLSCTSELLSSYIDLLLRSSEHQNLLLSPSWQGQTLDHEHHLAEMARLEEELERRRRQREEEEARVAEAQRKATEQPSATRLAGQPGVPRGRATIAGRGRGGLRGTTASTGSLSSNRAGSISTGTRGGRIRATTTRPSSIPAPSTTRGSSIRGRN